MIKKRKVITFLFSIMAFSTISSTEVYARYESTEDDMKPFVEQDFSFMSDDEGVETGVWQSYNANMRACTSKFEPLTTHAKYSVIQINTKSGIRTAPYVAQFSSDCSNDAEWQRDNHNTFFREKYGEMIVYQPVSLAYPDYGANTMKKIYENARTATNSFRKKFLTWGVPLNSNRCGYGYTYADGCRPSHSGGSGRETYPSGTTGEWENLGYSGDGYPIINSHFPTNTPQVPGTLASYPFDSTYMKSDKTSYDTATSGEKYKIKYDAIEDLIAQEKLSGSITSWMKKLSLKNNAATEAGIFKGTRESGGRYTIAVTKAPAAARYNLVLERVQLLNGSTVVGSYTRSAPLQENGKRVDPSSDLYEGKTYTLRFKVKNDAPIAINQKIRINYTFNGVDYYTEPTLNVGAGKSGEFSVNVTTPKEAKSFNINVTIPTGIYNQWNVDDKATIAVKVYHDEKAPTITNATASTACSKDSVTISVSSTEQPNNSYASGYKHVVLTRPDGSTATSTANPATFTVYSDGSYKVKSCDKNNNCSGEKTVTVNKIDKSPPTAMISGVPSTWTKNDVTVTVSGTDPSHNCGGIVKSWWKINNGAWQSVNAASKAVTLNTTGDHKFDYAVTDKVGNDSPTLTTYIKIDKTIPEVTMIDPIGLVKVGGSSNSVTYNIQKNDAHSGLHSYSTAWNNNAWGGWISHTSGNSNIKFTLGTNERDKVNTLWFRTKDKAGNIGKSFTRQVLYDVTGPSVTNYTITPYYNNKTTATVKVTAKDNFQDAGYTNVKYIYLSNDSTNWTRYTASNNSINVTWNTRTPDNWYNVYAKAEDSLGNVGPVQKIPYMTDRTKPTGTIKIASGQQHLPTESTTLNFTYGDNLSGVSKIEIYDINNGTASSNVHTINNPTATSLSWVLKPYTMSDGSIRAQVGMKITDKAGNVTTVKSQEIYISRVTISNFKLTNVVNPLVYNKTNPFRALTHPNIPEQQLLAGGSFSFSSNYVYPLGSVHNSWRVSHIATVQYQYPNGTTRNIKIQENKIKFSGTFAALHEIPFDIPVGTKVYIQINVKLHDANGNVFTQDYFPNPDGTLIYLGVIKDDIRNILQFNEIK